jgi:hypothetical protein
MIEEILRRVEELEEVETHFEVQKLRSEVAELRQLVQRSSSTSFYFLVSLLVFVLYNIFYSIVIWIVLYSRTCLFALSHDY